MIGPKHIWKKITNTKALENASGRLETAFFEDVYRISYAVGLSSADQDILYKIYSNVTKLLILLTMSGELWYVFGETLSVEEIFACINTMLIQAITVYRYGKMILHADMYKKLAASMESPYFDTSTPKRRNIVKYWVKRNESHLSLLMFLGNCTLIAWYLYPLLDDLDYNLFICIKLPFDYTSSPVLYFFTYIGCVPAFYLTAHFVMTNDVLMQAHLLHLVCQFDVLYDCIENILRDCESDFGGVDRNVLIKNERFKELYKKRLGDLVKQHRSILGHVMDLRTILSGPMLAQLAASGILICCISYEATTTGAENFTKCLMSLLYLGYNLFEFYIICRWCEEITIQSHRIGEAAYFSNWEYGMSEIVGVKPSLLMIIARANKPLVLTAGGMYNLSLESYASLVKTSYSGLTVLLRFRQN